MANCTQCGSVLDWIYMRTTEDILYRFFEDGDTRHDTTEISQVTSFSCPHCFQELDLETADEAEAFLHGTWEFPTEENRRKLARAVMADCNQGDLLEHAVQGIMDWYIKNREDFQQQWAERLGP